ncbi:MAG: lysylphosphatidylglycerol synthase transmembrane domain-containing protein [Terrimicrobiaceae bacterium]|nr:lysylphosphatidylglycerol synthase transmembrane domain-containing protein [Terrimicrobiaceae bacterium]
MRRYILPVIQVLVTVGLLAWIFRNPEQNRLMWEALKDANVLWLVPGVLAVGIAFLLQTQRWLMLMAVQGIQMRWWRAWRLMMVGAFFNLFLFGATGGDVIKIFYAMRETATKKSAAFLSVLVDRIVGLLALILVTGVLCALNFRQLTAHPVTAALMSTLAVILGGSFAVVVAGFLVDRLQLAHRLPTWIPLHARILEMASAFSIYARDGKTLLATLALSVPAHLLIFSAFYFSARAFTDALTVMNVFSVMPIINTITALPISLSGVGVREGLFKQLFGTMFGIPENLAVVISLMGFATTLFWGLVGGLVYVLYRPTGVHLSDIEKEVGAVEKDVEQRA